MTGIEPASSAWEADILPMNYICTTLILYHIFKINQEVFYNLFRYIYSGVTVQTAEKLAR